MDLLEAHAHFCETDDRSCVPVDVVVRGPLDSGDGWPLAATALASLSGWLEDATTEADLREAAAHGFSLWRSGILPRRALREEGERVLVAVLAWGEELEAKRCSNG